MSFIKFLYKYSGAEFVWRKFKPNKSGVLPTGPLWILGIYVASFGIASQRYENRIDFIETKANLLAAQFRDDSLHSTLEKIPSIQNLTCPTKPEILKPFTVIKSFIIDDYYWDMRENLKTIIVDYKHGLNGVNLSFGDLSGINLNSCYLQHALLIGVDFSGADLRDVDFYKADLSGAILSGAYLDNSNLHDVMSLTLNQLLETKSLYNVRGLNKDLIEQIKKIKPSLFEPPINDKLIEE